MREIKFRIYSPSQAYQGMIHFGDPYLNNEYNHLAFQTEQTEVDTATDEDWIIMQYTGLKDKNGVEIFEGDLIQKTNSQTGQKTAKSVVTYNARSARFAGLSFGTSMNMEVIGNIYEGQKS